MLFFSTENLYPFGLAHKLPVTNHPAPQQALQFKTATENLASVDLHDPTSHMQRSKSINKQMPEEITADLQSKCPLSCAVLDLCDHNGGVVASEHGDIKLTIPKGAIKEGDVVTFSVASNLYAIKCWYTSKATVETLRS